MKIINLLPWNLCRKYTKNESTLVNYIRGLQTTHQLKDYKGLSNWMEKPGATEIKVLLSRKSIKLHKDSVGNPLLKDLKSLWTARSYKCENQLFTDLINSI